MNEKYISRQCPICGKKFVPSYYWAYRSPKGYACSYTCYVKAGGDGGLDRLNGKKRRYYNNTKGAR